MAWHVAGVAAAIGGALALREGSVHPWAIPRKSGDAQVRLSWSARPERVEQCRRLSDAELAELPPHMRLRLQCEGVFARYLLTVRVDSSGIASDTIRGGGLRHDRPIRLFREIGVPSGQRRVKVEVARLDSTSAAGDTTEDHDTPGDTLLGFRAGREADERQRRAREAMPARLVLDTLISLAPGHVLLVAYDETARRLTGRMARSVP